MEIESMLEGFKVKVLGISATTVKGKKVKTNSGEFIRNNTEYILDVALEEARKVGPVETEWLRLSDYRLEHCIGCDGCIRRAHDIQKEIGFDVSPIPVKDYNCSIKDDMGILHKKMLEADGIIFSTPVWILSCSSLLWLFIHRMRTFGHDRRLKDKECGTICTCHFRNGGQMTTLQDVNRSMYGFMKLATLGGAVVTTEHGTGKPVRGERFAAAVDNMGLMEVKVAGRDVAMAAIKKKLATLALPYVPNLAKGAVHRFDLDQVILESKGKLDR
ncbi:flavodoxin family protein [Thermodesulfobacteriota bacterium]